LDIENSTGNGFRFDHYNSDAFRWSIDRAMDFYALPAEIREREIRRIMIESEAEFSHKEVARRYINIYEEMLARPLVEKESGEVIKAIADSISETLPKL
jgi:starch synthase/alpha-amylase